MKSHRMRSAKSIDGTERPHLFVEVKSDSWLEVNAIPTHRQVHAIKLWRREKGRMMGLITYGTRAFNIGIVRDWMELSPVS